MAKIKMAQVAGLPVRTLRRLVGIPAHRPSGFNACIAASLRGKKHPPAGPGQGGKNNLGWRQQFISAVQSCRGAGGGRRRRAETTA